MCFVDDADCIYIAMHIFMSTVIIHLEVYDSFKE